MTTRFDLDEIIPDSELWAKLDEFKIAYVDALIEAEEVEDPAEFYGKGKSNAWHQVHMNAQFVISGRPGVLDAIPENLAVAMRDLQAAKGYFDGLDRELAAWSGIAADDFKDKYQDVYPQVHADQFTVLMELAGFAFAYRQLMARARLDFVSMLDSAIAACKSYEKSSGGASGWNILFKAVGMGAMAAGMVAAIAGTGGAALAAGATIVGGFAAFGSDYTEPEASTARIGFESPQAILAQLKSHSGSLCDTMVTESDHLLSLLTGDLSAVGDGEALIIRRPDVARLKPNEYITNFPYVGATNIMTVDLKDLWKAGARRMPLVANEYATAAKQVGYCDWRIRSALGSAEFVGGGVVDNLVYLYDVVEARLGEMRDDLMSVGEVFVAIAEAYTTEDDNGADALSQLLEREMEHGNLDDIPTYVPTVAQPDIDTPPDTPEPGEAPSDYRPATMTVPVAPNLNGGTTNMVIEVSPSDVPGSTQRDEYDPNGQHGGNTAPPGVLDDED